MKQYVMAISFQNGKHLNIGIEHAELEKIKENAFQSMKDSTIMQLENICFRTADTAFIAFYETPEKAESDHLSNEPINAETQTAENG